jgi:hypothetical protein
MPVEVGDKIRILRNNLQSARVEKGDTLTVVGHAVPGVIVTNAPRAALKGTTWWFSASLEGDGWEAVHD